MKLSFFATLLCAILASGCAHAGLNHRTTSGPPPPPTLLVSGGVAIGSWAALTQPADQGNPGDLGYSQAVVASFDSVPYQTVTGNYSFGVIAAHEPTTTEFGAGVTNNVDHVTCAMDNGAAVTVNVRTTNPVTGFPAYMFTVDPTDVGNTDGLHEVRCTVYPTTGRPLVLQGPVRTQDDSFAYFIADASHPYMNLNGPPSGSTKAITKLMRFDSPHLPPNTLITDASGTATCGAVLCTGTGGGGTYPTNISLDDGGSFTGSISGTTMTITGVTSGVIQATNEVSGTGIVGTTFVNAFGGTCAGSIPCTGAGGTGTYLVSRSQTATGSITITAYVAYIALATENSFYVYTNGHGTSHAVFTRIVSNSGTNALGCGDGVNPDCLTIPYAIDKINALAAGNDVGGSTIQLKPGSYNYNFGGSGTTSDNASQWLTITKHSSATQANAIISDAGSSSGIKVAKVHLQNITVALPLQASQPSLSSPTNIGNSMGALWADNIIFTAGSHAFGSTQLSSNFFGGVFATGGNYSKTSNAVQNCNLFANATVTDASFVGQGCNTLLQLTMSNIDQYVYGGRNTPVVVTTGTIGDTCLHNTQQWNGTTLVAYTPNATDFPTGAQVGIGASGGTPLGANSHTVALGTCDGANSITLDVGAIAANVTTGHAPTTWLSNLAHDDMWITSYTIHNNLLFAGMLASPSIAAVGVLTSGTNSGGLHNVAFLNDTFGSLGSIFTFTNSDGFMIINSSLDGPSNMGSGSWVNFTMTNTTCTVAMPVAVSPITKQGTTGC